MVLESLAVFGRVCKSIVYEFEVFKTVHAKFIIYADYFFLYSAQYVKKFAAQMEFVVSI